MRIAILCAVAVLGLSSVGVSSAPIVKGPEQGTLVIVGGGKIGPEVLDRFFRAAGGRDAPIVVIPTAGGAATYGQDWKGLDVLRNAGATNLTVLHTTSRATANSPAFVAPLKRARGVFIPGGRQWHLVDSYLGTLTEREIKAVLKRGGVVGGTSAGASIQASYLVRGARSGNEIVMAPGYERGFGLLKEAAVDQHVTVRHREKDLDAVVVRHPNLLGIGLDEGTAIVVTKQGFDVVGPGHAFIHEEGASGPLPIRLMSNGEHFNLTRLEVSPAEG